MAITLGCACAATIAAPPSDLPPDARVLDAKAVVDAGARADGRRLLGDWFGMLSRGEDSRLARVWVEDRARTDSLAWEWASSQLLDSLRVDAPRAELEPALATLAAHVPVVYVRHAETASDWFVPAFDVAGSAQWLRHAWAVQQRADAWVDALVAGGGLLRARTKLATPDALDADALRLAVQHADVDVLHARAAELADAGVPGILTALALRTRAPGDFFTALEREPAAQALDLVAGASDRLPPRDAVAFLERAARRDELASAAMLALVPLAGEGSAARGLLLESIGDRDRGESAAAALARLDDTRVFDTLAARLRGERDPVAQRHLLLYLRLRGEEVALEHAREFAASASAAPDLAREVATW